MLDKNGFDLWANDYEKDVSKNEENGGYPFAGYRNVLNTIYNKVRSRKSADVLDIGFGTGFLTTQLYNDGYKITGIDFSDKMIDIAKRKMPRAALIKWDFANGLPDEVKNKKYDFILSTYAIHHISDGKKAALVRQFGMMLNTGGKVLFGDVSFETGNDREKCKSKYEDIWDYDEMYIAFDEFEKALGSNFICSFEKISHCAGVLTIENK